MLNKTFPVLVESMSKRNDKECSGRTENNRVVNFIGGERLIGNVIDVIITEVKKHTLFGELVTTH